MTTTFDIETALFQKLAAEPVLTNDLSIYKRIRPLGNVESIVINSLPVANQVLMLAIANVNIYVPDLPINELGSERLVPNLERLDELTKIVIGLLDDKKNGEYFHEVQQQRLIQDEESGAHYSNLRINFYSINILN